MNKLLIKPKDILIVKFNDGFFDIETPIYPAQLEDYHIPSSLIKQQEDGNYKLYSLEEFSVEETYVSGASRWDVVEYVDDIENSEWFVRLEAKDISGRELIIGCGNIKTKSFDVTGYMDARPTLITETELEMCLVIIERLKKVSFDD